MPASRASRSSFQSVRSSPSAGNHASEATTAPILRGYLESLSDALIVIEAAKRGLIGRLVTKPSELEKEQYARSGNILIFEESEVGIRRWTDPLTWSETRASPPYFIYRETTSSNHPSLTSRASKAATRSPVRPRGVSFDLQRLLGAMSSGKKCRNHGLVLENGMCKRTITIELPGRKWHIISYYYLEDILSGDLKRPSTMIPLGDLIRDISEELLDPMLYYRKGRNCLLLTRRTEDGRLVYAGETDEPPSKRERSSLGLENDGTRELLSSSSLPLHLQEAPYIPVLNQSHCSWDETLSSQRPPHHLELPYTSTPSLHSSSPTVPFGVPHYHVTSLSSCSVTNTLNSFSSQGWEFDNQLDPSESWVPPTTSNAPSRSAFFSSLPVTETQQAPSTPSDAWASPPASNLFWAEPSSLDPLHFPPSSPQESYQLYAIGDPEFAQLAPQETAERGTVAGMNSGIQQTGVWWNNADSTTYGDLWSQPIHHS
ncbi:hypothetical protein FRB90_012785 [Tulasnella sp. 427]|nr:hypothetical protein FRB90_012785 [Tulasnella sp. 427]